MRPGTGSRDAEGHRFRGVLSCAHLQKSLGNVCPLLSLLPRVGGHGCVCGQDPGTSPPTTQGRVRSMQPAHPGRLGSRAVALIGLQVGCGAPETACFGPFRVKPGPTVGPMSSANELFTIERSHGAPRLTAPRPSDLGTVPTEEERSRNHTVTGTFAFNNRAAVGRSAKAVLRKPYREAKRRVCEALAGQREPADSDRVLGGALALFHAARRELGSGSPLVQGPALTYAVETVLAGFFLSEAAHAGFSTRQGLLMHERAMLCETQANRALATALAAARVVGTGRGNSAGSLAELERKMRLVANLKHDPTGA